MKLNKLHIQLEKDGLTLKMKILKQDKYAHHHDDDQDVLYKEKNFQLISRGFPELTDDAVFLRGCNSDLNNEQAEKTYISQEELTAVVSFIQRAVKKVVKDGKVILGKGFSGSKRVPNLPSQILLDRLEDSQNKLDSLKEQILRAKQLQSEVNTLKAAIKKLGYKL